MVPNAMITGNRDLIVASYPISVLNVALKQALKQALNSRLNVVLEAQPYQFIEGYNSRTVRICSSSSVRTYDTQDELRFWPLLTSCDTSKGNITHRSHIFTDYYVLPKYVCTQAQRSLAIENAGGQSEISEMYSIDYFASIYNASLFIFEKEIKYWIDYKMVDYICTVKDQHIGVSVARAMGFPTSDCFTAEIAARLVHKKLYGLIIARNSVINSQSFTKSVLHIWCQDKHIAKLLREAYTNLDYNDYGLDVKGIVILQLTICDDRRIYKNTMT